MIFSEKMLGKTSSPNAGGKRIGDRLFLIFIFASEKVGGRRKQNRSAACLRSSLEELEFVDYAAEIQRM